MARISASPRVSRRNSTKAPGISATQPAGGRIPLDDLDNQIIEALRQDGRQANTQLARQFGVSETTVRNRIQRLRDAGIIEVRAFVDMRQLGLDWDILILVNVAPGRVDSVVEQLSALYEVRYVAFVTGRFDLLVAAFFRSQPEVFTFLTEKLGRIEGIVRTETMHRLKAMKYDSMRFL